MLCYNRRKGKCKSNFESTIVEKNGQRHFYGVCDFFGGELRASNKDINVH
jgi:hypothetical protein